LNRTRFLGHLSGLRRHGHGRRFVLAAEGRGAEVACLLGQPLGVVSGDAGAERLSDVRDGLVDAAMDDLLLQGPQEASTAPFVAGSPRKASLGATARSRALHCCRSGN
jgi:hypothetical protein